MIIPVGMSGATGFLGNKVVIDSPEEAERRLLMAKVRVVRVGDYFYSPGLRCVDRVSRGSTFATCTVVCFERGSESNRRRDAWSVVAESEGVNESIRGKIFNLSCP